MKKSNNKGFSLIEILVALPLIALVFLGLGYMLGSTGTFTAVKIAKTKTLVAANNVLMIFKSQGYKYSELGDKLGFVQTYDKLNEKNINVIGTAPYYIGELIPPYKNDKKENPIHPDFVTNLYLKLEEKDSVTAIADGDVEGIDSDTKICIITVTAPGFENVQTIIKTVSY